MERWAEPRAVKGGAPRYKGRTHARLALSPWFMRLSCPVSPVVQFFFFSLGSCARGPVSGLLVGVADGRRSSAGCVVDLRVRTRGAGEGSPAMREARIPGASTLAVMGAGRHGSATTEGRSSFCFV